MAAETEAGHGEPNWWVAPGDGDFMAFVAIIIMIALLYLIVYLYAAFDRWAEHKSKGTPLAKTIPTLLAIALLYEIFPLDHFHVLLPVSAILLALIADWSRFHVNSKTKITIEETVSPEPEDETVAPEPIAETPVQNKEAADHV